MAVRDLTALTTIKDRLWVRIYIFIYIYFLFLYFSIEFFEGVSRGDPYRWSMDRSVRWSVDLVRWTGPRTRGQCFRITPNSRHNLHRTTLRAEAFRWSKGLCSQGSIGQVTFKIIHSALLVYNGRLLFLHYNCVFDLSAGVNRTDLGVYLRYRQKYKKFMQRKIEWKNSYTTSSPEKKFLHTGKNIYSYKGNVNKKIRAARKFPPHPTSITFLMVRP